jgi:D-serine dehydratase
MWGIVSDGNFRLQAESEFSGRKMTHSIPGLGALSLEKGAPLEIAPAGKRTSSTIFENIPLPVAVILKPVLERNSRWMRRFISLSTIDVAPHGKTTMVPEIFKMQIADGAWAITLSTLQQVRAARRFGINRIFFANILVDAAEIKAIFSELDRDPLFEFYCLVDSKESVAILASCFETNRWRRPIYALVELGYSGGRTGCRTAREALDIARLTSRAGSGVRLVGVEGFEGLISAPTMAGRDVGVSLFVGELVALALKISEEGLFDRPDFILSAGGSGFIDIVVSGLRRVREAAPVCRILIRSGCYISFDSGQYTALFERMAERRSAGFVDIELPEAALEVWGRVLSRPEPHRAIVGVGKRDLGHDVDMPRAIKWLRSSQSDQPMEFVGQCRVVELNDQHAHLEINHNVDLRFGDMVGFGVSHPCTTFDKWRQIQVVDDRYRVIETYLTYF